MGFLYWFCLQAFVGMEWMSYRQLVRRQRKLTSIGADPSKSRGFLGRVMQRTAARAEKMQLRNIKQDLFQPAKQPSNQATRRHKQSQPALPEAEDLRGLRRCPQGAPPLPETPRKRCQLAKNGSTPKNGSSLLLPLRDVRLQEVKAKFTCDIVSVSKPSPPSWHL